MRIRESFELPGLSSPETVIRSYDTLPRQMTLVGLRFDIALRVTSCKSLPSSEKHCISDILP